MLNMDGRATVYFSVNGIHLLAKIETMETSSRKFELLTAMVLFLKLVTEINIHCAFWCLQARE